MDPPVDRFNMVYMICCWLGIGMLFPWNFFLAADGYWRFKFRNTENVTGTNTTVEDSDLQVFWGSSLSLVSMGTNFFFLFLNAAFGHKMRITPRLYGSIIFNIVLFVVTLVFTFPFIDTDSWQIAFFSITLATALLFNMNDSIFQGAFSSLMGRFPASYMSALSQGQALGGTISAVISFILLNIGGTDTFAARFSFIFAAAFLTSMTILLYVVSKKEFFQYYAPDENSLKEGSESQNPDFWLVLRETLVFDLAILINFWITLGVFPAIQVLVKSNSAEDSWFYDNFHSVGIFVVFNACDYIGRISHSLIKWPKATKLGSYVALAAAVARVVFIPLFMFCDAQPRHHTKPISAFQNDVVFVIINALFGLTSGYVANACMTCTPKMVKEPENQGFAGSVMIFMLMCGLFAGAGTSFLWVLLL